MTAALARTPSRGADALGAIVRGPVSRRAHAELLYVLGTLPVAVGGCVFAVGSTLLGIGLTLTFVGLPFLAATGLAIRRLGAFQRGMARVLLNEEVPAPRPFAAGPGLFGWLQAAVLDPVSWRARAYQVLRLPLTMVMLYAVLVFWAQALFCLTYPIWWQLSAPGAVPQDVFLDLNALVFRGRSQPRIQSEHRITLALSGMLFDTWPKALLAVLIGLAGLLAAPWILRGPVWLDRWLISWLLGPTAESERVRQLESARALLAADSASTLRRIERDLHDGTQAQLATLAMTLGQAKEKLEHRPGVPYDPTGALDLVDTAHQHAKEALLELRDIARGIHPPALDVGLDAALATLVARSAVPAVLYVEIPTRPDRAIETIAYFSVAELLANVAKHSRAGRATVKATARDGKLHLRVSDDGVGGAQPGSGSGLPGLAERVGAVDGHLEVTSPPGGPTVINVDLPLHA